MHFGRGSLGILIPPSVLMIILALTSRVSVGEMFIAGILPGLLLSSLFVTYILIRCYFQKDMGPSVPEEERLPPGERVKLAGALVLPIGLIFAVMGSMFFGIATPSEASAIGALGAIVSAMIKRTFNWESFTSALFITLRLSAMVIWIVFAASAYTALYAVTGAASLVGTLIKGVGDPWMVIITMQLILFVLGMFFDPTGIVLLTAPIFFPIITSLGFDPLWFAILFVINMELAYLTPPFGFNLFYMKAVVPPGITMIDIYKSQTPFVLLMILGLILCMIFPGIITWLPSLMRTLKQAERDSIDLEKASRDQSNFFRRRVARSSQLWPRSRQDWRDGKDKSTRPSSTIDGSITKVVPVAAMASARVISLSHGGAPRRLCSPLHGTSPSHGCEWQSDEISELSSPIRPASAAIWTGS